MPTSGQEARQARLEELAQAVAARPFSLDRALKACEAIEEAHGIECRIEAVAVAAAFELNTKGADLTGKAPFEGWMLRIMYLVLSFIRYLLSILTVQRWA